MNKTILALYDDRSDAEAAVRDLTAEGFDRGVTDIVSHGDAGLQTGTGGGMLSRLTGWNIPENEAHVYAEGVRRGGTLLTLRVDDDDVDRAIAVLERGAVVDINHRGEAYRSTGWSGYDETAAPYDATSAAEERTRYSVNTTAGGDRLGSAAEAFRATNTGMETTAGTTATGVEREEVIPVTEEEISVGKRAVERGTVRVRSYVVETPVEEQVRLRDETVTVERRPVSREAGDIPADAFRERSIEVTETDEEAVVQKHTRVKEEVVIRKDVQERAQTVSDTVRRTEVEIDDGRGGADRTVRRDDVRRDDVDR